MKIIITKSGSLFVIFMQHFINQNNNSILKAHLFKTIWLIKRPFKYLKCRFFYPFILSLMNSLLFIYLKPKKGFPCGWSLPIKAIKGSAPVQTTRPFLQNEGKKALNSHANKTHLTLKGFAPGLSFWKIGCTKFMHSPQHHYCRLSLTNNI